MLSKILLCTIRGKINESSIKAMFFDGSFKKKKKKKDSVNSFISICFSDLKDQRLQVSEIKTHIEDNRPKILLAWRAHKWSRQLACSNYGPIGQSGHLLMSKPDSCEIISKSDHQFRRRRFFKNFFMSL